MTRRQKARLETRLADLEHPPQILDLPHPHPARLAGDLRAITAAIAHVDRMFDAVRYAGSWWLFLKDGEAVPSLVSASYYLLRRVLAMDQLQTILEDLDDDLDGDGEAEAEHFPLFVWGRSFGPLAAEDCN